MAQAPSRVSSQMCSCTPSIAKKSPGKCWDGHGLPRAESRQGTAVVWHGSSAGPAPRATPVPERFCQWLMAQVWVLRVSSSPERFPAVEGMCRQGTVQAAARGAGAHVGFTPRLRTREVSPRPALQLLARIERMERRVQLVKKDSEREKHRIFQSFEVDEKPEAEVCEKLPLECPQDLLEPTPTLQPKHFPYGRNGKGHKR